ncbi:MAG: hypothetical protein JSS09_06000, partial [Verrucomicrobia bacterium]|nr:hypothetical protein [Verrucomicrobiota bacterium]
EVSEKLIEKVEEIDTLCDNQDPTTDSKIDKLVGEVLLYRKELEELHKYVFSKVYNLKASLNKEALIEERAKCSKVQELITLTASDIQAYKDKLMMRRAFHRLENAFKNVETIFDDWKKIKGESGESSEALAEETKKIKVALQSLEKEYAFLDKKRKEVHVPERADVKEKQNELLITVPDQKDRIVQIIKKHEEKLADDELFRKVASGVKDLEALEAEWIKVISDGCKLESEKVNFSNNLKKSASELVKYAGLGDNRVIRSDKSSWSERRETVEKAKKLANRLILQASLIIDTGGVSLDSDALKPSKKPSLISRALPYVGTAIASSAVTALACGFFLLKHAKT